MSQDFNKGKIYKITNNYNDEVYIGSTCDTLNRRITNHKRSSKTEKKQNIPIYKLMNEIGFERFRIELIEDFPCTDKYELRQREGH
jgi:group I intron endonuclease